MQQDLGHYYLVYKIDVDFVYLRVCLYLLHLNRQLLLLKLAYHLNHHFLIHHLHLT
uniref:Uncharacterized protein n=1 Tax=uncultured marine virus TaxID=186617 RepID=A0A0F7L710_9VIRU|nr:hypothetical protein [uncultured marine virus]